MKNGITLNKGLLSAAALVLSASVTNAYAVSGEVKFTGAIIESTCDVSAEDKNKTVDIGIYPTTVFPVAGSVSSAKSFTLTLDNCKPGDYAVNFDGTTVQGNDDLLAVDEATGVGIEILTSENATLPINVVAGTVQPLLTIEDGSQTGVINLKARYRSFNNTVTAGDANANATFTIEYK